MIERARFPTAFQSGIDDHSARLWSSEIAFESMWLRLFGMPAFAHCIRKRDFLTVAVDKVGGGGARRRVHFNLFDIPI